MLNVCTWNVLVASVLMQSCIDLVYRKQFPKYVPVSAGTKISNARQKFQGFLPIRDSKPIGFKLRKQLVAFLEFLGVLHVQQCTTQ